MPYKDKSKQREFQLDWHKRNREQSRKRFNARRKAKKEKVRVLKESEPCMDCAKHYPYYVMDYDHVKGNKNDEVSKMVAQNRAWERIQTEIDKCELVCGNCHRARTHQRSMNNS